MSRTIKSISVILIIMVIFSMISLTSVLAEESSLDSEEKSDLGSTEISGFVIEIPGSIDHAEIKEAFFHTNKLAVSCVYTENLQDDILYLKTVQCGKTVEQKYQYLYAPDTIQSPLNKRYLIISEANLETEEIFLLKEDIYPKPAGIQLNNFPKSLTAGKAFAMNWTMLPGNTNEKKVTWESSDPTVVKVSQKGVIRGLKAGMATISVYSTYDPQVNNSFKMRVLFKDVKSSASYYYKPVYWAFDSGYTEGISDTTFGAKEVYTRSELIRMLWKIAGSPRVKGKLSYKDTLKLKPSSEEYQAILWGTKNKLTHGVSKTIFNPNGYCKKCHIVTFLYKYINNVT